MATSYVALLRAVNVGGRVVKMERLRELFTQLGFAKVRTFIQSGNVFFESPKKDPAALARSISTHLEAELGFEVPAFVRTVDELARSIALDPFKKIRVTEDMRLCMVFVSAPLPAELALPHRSPKGEFEILKTTPGEAFVLVRQKPGKAENPAAYVEKVFKVKATSRFYDTAGKMLAAARAG